MTRWRGWLEPAAWLLATGLLVFLATRVDLARVWLTFQSAHWGWSTLAVACFIGIQPLGSLQWRALLPVGATLGFRRLFRIWTLTSIANNTTTSLVGHLTGLAMLGAEPSLGRVPALSVLALDQVAVGLTKVAVLAVAAWIAPLPDWMFRGTSVLATTVLVLVVVVTAASWHYARIGAWASAPHEGRLTRRIAPVVAAWTAGLDALRSPGRFATALGFAVAIRLAELAAIVCVQFAFGLEASLTNGVLVLAATSLASFVMFVPANIGTYEAATFAAYRLIGIPAETALGLALVQHACQLLPAVGVGYGVLTVERLRGTRVDAAETQRP
ncbi:MAG: lysylphosphatidylglycerol synthase transmembrane domain-containing protein [Gemmatimonadota bacterium]